VRLSLRQACLPLIILAAPVAAHAQAGDTAVARFNECAAIQDDAQRLSCFDRVTREVRANAAAASQREVQSKATRAERERDDFGLNVIQKEQKRPEEASTVKELTARVAAARRIGPGYYAIMLEDGAIWQVQELDPYFRPPDRGDTVRIRRGLMGGYLLDVGKQPSVRVRRVS
jgi:hypothetical protein